MGRGCVRGLEREAVRGVWGGYDMDAFYTFVELLKNKLKILFKKDTHFF